MAARETKRELRKQARRNAIVRTSRIWTKLYKELTSELKDISHKWLKSLLRQAEHEISSGTLTTVKELPERFTRRLTQTLRHSLAQGYLLNHVYVHELKKAREGKKYHGRITLSDEDDEARLIASLEKFISSEEAEEWHEVIPEEAVNWLKDYVPKLAGVLSEDVTSKVNSVIRESMMTGTTLQERMKALRESSEVIQRMTDARIEAIARTEITRADTMGRLISMKSNEDVIGVEFSAIMDDRTTEICSSRHGLFMRLDDPRLPENTPPLHCRCRSLLIPCTVYDFPDGLLTSHEFDEVPASKQRDYDIEEVRKILEDMPT